MATARAQILREADNQFTLLFFTPNPDGMSEDLASSQVNLANAGAAIAALTTLIGGLPGVMYKTTVSVQTR